MKLSVNNSAERLGNILLKGLVIEPEHIFKDLAKNVATAKAKIDEIGTVKQWDRIKKRTNPYELIYNSNNWNKKSNSVARYLAMSRSFYKLWEMMFDYDLLVDFKGDNLVSANLAEGPGGFIEALIKYRQRGGENDGDNFFGITLKPDSKYIPGWEKVKGDKFRNVRTLFGSLYDVNVVDIYCKIVNERGGAHIVTADGGFDYSIDFNQQERLSYHLIFAEIVTALLVQRCGGHFVCKVFDIFDMFSLKCLYLLTFFYKSIEIVKPKTSRPANSEKYIVCKGFVGVRDDERIVLRNCLKEFEKVGENLSIKSFDLVGLNMSEKFISEIRKYNEVYCKGQIECIDQTLDIINTNLTHSAYNEVLEYQVDLAINWCKYYHVEINKDSYYVKKFCENEVWKGNENY